MGKSGVAGESGVGTPGGGVAHRGRLLEGDADAAARDVFDGLFGLVVEAVTPHAVTGRVAGGSGGRGSTRDPAVRQEDEAAVHAAHDGGGHRVGVEMGRGACVCVCECGKVMRAKARNVFRKGNVFAF